MTDTRPHNHWKLFITLAIVAGLSTATGLFVRSLAVDDRTYRLCERIHAVVSGNTELKPGQPGYRYYTEIAPEENAARAEIRRKLGAAFGNCESFR